MPECGTVTLQQEGNCRCRQEDTWEPVAKIKLSFYAVARTSEADMHVFAMFYMVALSPVNWRKHYNKINPF